MTLAGVQALPKAGCGLAPPPAPSPRLMLAVLLLVFQQATKELPKQPPRDDQKICTGPGYKRCSTNMSALTAKGCFHSWGSLAKDKPIVQAQNTILALRLGNGHDK